MRPKAPQFVYSGSGRAATDRAFAGETSLQRPFPALQRLKFADGHQNSGALSLGVVLGLVLGSGTAKVVALATEANRNGTIPPDLP